MNFNNEIEYVNIDELKDNPLWYRLDIEVKNMILELENQNVNPNNIIIIGRKLEDGTIRIVDGHVRRLFFKKQVLNGDTRFSKIRVHILKLKDAIEELKEHANRYNITKRTNYEKDLMYYRFLVFNESPFFNNKELFRKTFSFKENELTQLIKTTEYRNEFIKKYKLKTTNDIILNITRQVLYAIISKRNTLSDEVVESILSNWNRKWNNINILYNELLKPLNKLTSIEEKKKYIEDNKGSGKSSSVDSFDESTDEDKYSRFIVSGLCKTNEQVIQLINDIKKLRKLCVDDNSCYNFIGIRNDDLISDIKVNIDSFMNEYNRFIKEQLEIIK